MDIGTHRCIRQRPSLTRRLVNHPAQGLSGGYTPLATFATVPALRDATHPVPGGRSTSIYYSWDTKK